MNTWQPVEQRVRNLFSRVRTHINLFRYQYFPQHNQSQKIITAHLLVVKNSKYSELARTCISSFLHFHPKSKVIVHFDRHTKTSIMNWVSKSRFSRSINLRLVESSTESWQIQKLNLVLELAGTNDFFIDADMRWNGPLMIDLEKDRRIHFLVREFQLDSHNAFAKMLRDEEFKHFSSASMFNTSFVCFSGLNLTDFQKEQVLLLQKQIVFFAQSSEISEIERNSMVRISEQLALSMAASNWDKPVGAIKDLDGCKDGTFLESSYFGATGLKF